MDSAPDRSFATEYFANLNEISKKIAIDIEEIRSAYEHIWDDLSREEQMEIVNETIIKPELALKYFDSFSTSSDSLQRILGTVDDAADDDRNANLYDGKELQTFQYVRTGRKAVTDDSIGMFRDEHSAPFSHKTKSQINLTIFPPEKDSKTGAGVKGVMMAKKLLLKSPKLDDANCNGVKGKEGVHVLSKGHKSETAAGGGPLFDSERNILSSDETGTKGGSAGFLTKFNNLIFNQTPIEMTTAESAASMDGSDEVDGAIDQDEFDTDNDKVNLFSKSSKNECLHRAQSSSVEEDDKNYDELNSLLGTSKGFDFLNNW